MVPWKNDPTLSRRIGLEAQLSYLNSLGVTEERLKEIHEIEEELRRFPPKD